MPSLRRLTALAMARALLAGPADAPGLAARLRSCLGLPREHPAPWVQPLAERCARLPGEHWRRLTPRTLATLVERDAGFVQAWARPHQRPRIHRLLLHWRPQMQPPPLGLDQCTLPPLPDAAALAQWLRVPPAGLWRLTLPAAWQRRQPLGHQHYRSQLLAKRRGGWRLLEVPEPHLQALQRRVLHGLLSAVPPHEAACGFTRGRSVLDHARAHAGQPVLLCFDLQDFFSSVPAARVQALFTTLGYPEDVARSVTRLCTVATPEPVLQRLHAEGGLPWPQRQRLRGAHLPQGAPSSPALANLCAFGLDLRLAGLAQALGARYTRYADDIVLSGGQHLAARAAPIAAWVGRIALEQGFALNHRKTRVLPQGRAQAVCGVVVNAHPNLPRADFDRLKAILHQCVLHGAAAQNREGHADWRAHLEGRVAWAAQVNPAKARRLQRLLAQVDWAR
jgi:hypothetical protein